MVFLITYDLNQPGQKYNELYESIKKCGAWAHYLDSTWLVDTSLTADGIYNQLKPTLDENDMILVIGLTRDYSGWLPKEAWEWIREHSSQMAAA